jgi:II/X family phage/plasmid replication protein
MSFETLPVAGLPSSCAMMIDYITARISLPRPLPAPINGGHFLRVDECGEIERTTALRKRVLGSFEAALQIRAPGIHELEISGNPVKFVQGHNLWGTACPVAALWAALLHLEASGALPVSLRALGLLGPSSLAECTQLSRVDCTAMLLGERWLDVETSLRSLRVAGRLRDRGASGLPHPWPESQGGGVTFGGRPGQSARHRQLTFYAKGKEVKVHPLPDALGDDSELMQWVARCLRCEVRLGTNYLRKRGLRSLAAWSEETAGAEWAEMMERIDMNGSDEKPEALAGLLPHLQVAYAAWESGADLQSMFPRRTFYRKRADILKATGVDIAIPRPKDPTAEIIPFRRVIELRPAGRPAFADRIDRMLSGAA